MAVVHHYITIIFIVSMDNIEIKKGKSKRSVESIIDQSLIDHEYNYETQQLRKAFSISIRDYHDKIRDYEREIGRLNSTLSQKQSLIEEMQGRQAAKDAQLLRKSEENAQLRKANHKIKKRLQHVDYKLEIIEKNRDFAHMDNGESDEDQALKDTAKKEAYKEISEIITSKVAKFTKDVKAYPMSVDLEQTIEAFLEDIVYINPVILRQNIFVPNKKKRVVGQISERKNPHAKTSQYEEWQFLQKSLQKLKNMKQSPSPIKVEGRTINEGRVRHPSNHNPHSKRLNINYT